MLPYNNMPQFVHPDSIRDVQRLANSGTPGASAWHRIVRWLKDEVVTAPLVPVLHTSPLRMKGLGLFTLFGHPLFWFVWAVWLPQPYENLPLRLVTASLGLLLISDRISSDPSSRLSAQVFTAIFWFELPFLFSWMYLCNGGNHAWLASMAAMILTYYFATDWRLATVGIALGGLAARLLFEIFGPSVPPMAPDVFWTNTMVLAFCISMGMLMGLSSANLRREHLANTLATMGIMAHELRTPLATMALIGDAVRCTVTEDPAQAQPKLEQLSTRLHMLVRNMNHQIDTQIANARLMRLPSLKEALSAGELVVEAVANYPYRSTRERECVVVKITNDFVFEASPALFAQVFDNLMKNALRSLAAASSASRPGDLSIEVAMADAGRGRIMFSDRGVGIDPELQPRIFEPFFSTNRGTGHGLGLAFCRQVVYAARGTIDVQSQLGHGATFTIELPAIG
jgi:two-component system, CAI-1 autoinducer sensor kinase/phosphatase CqsS